jgi:hypothetical protein
MGYMLGKEMRIGASAWQEKHININALLSIMYYPTLSGIRPQIGKGERLTTLERRGVLFKEIGKTPPKKTPECHFL